MGIQSRRCKNAKKIKIYKNSKKAQRMSCTKPAIQFGIRLTGVEMRRRNSRRDWDEFMWIIEKCTENLWCLAKEQTLQIKISCWSLYNGDRVFFFKSIFIFLTFAHFISAVWKDEHAFIDPTISLISICWFGHIINYFISNSFLCTNKEFARICFDANRLQKFQSAVCLVSVHWNDKKETGIPL